jgi:hypothetical protein
MDTVETQQSTVANKTTTNPEGNNTLKEGNTTKRETKGNGKKTTIRWVARYPNHHWLNWPGPNPVLKKPTNQERKPIYLAQEVSRKRNE